MRRNEALRTIRQRLDDGLSRDEIVSEFEEKIEARSKPALLRYVAAVPDAEDRQKYKKLNLTLFFLLLYFSLSRIFVFLVFNDFSAKNLFPVLITSVVFIYLAMNVWVFRGDIYNKLGLFLGIFGGAISFPILYAASTRPGYFAGDGVFKIILVFFFDLVPTIVAVFLAFYLARKVFPQFSLLGRLKINQK